MKKFLIYLGAIIATVSLGFTVFYLVRNDETLSISLEEVYVNTGDEFSIDLNHENPKAYTNVQVVLAGGDNDTTVILVSEENDIYTFKAGTAGLTQITFRTDNENFRNLSCKVYVGDGSSQYPFYISSAEQVERIGTQAEQDKGYGGYSLNSCYKLINNINLKNGTNKTGCWIPIGTGVIDADEQPVYFTGSFNGNGKIISGIRINKDEYNDIRAEASASTTNFINAGLFSVVGKGGLVYGLEVRDISIIGKYATVGSIAGINNGTIESVKVENASFKVKNSDYVGGIAGKNISSYMAETSTTEYSRYIARIDRCSVSGVFGEDFVDVLEAGETETHRDYSVGRLSGTVGGLTAYNEAGIVIYSYVKGTVYLSGENVVFGGIVGINKDADLHNAGPGSTYRYPSEMVGGHVKNCYSTLSLYVAQVTATDVQNRIGGIVAHNISSTTTVLIIDDIQFAITAQVDELDGTVETKQIDNNKIVGNYYRVKDAASATRLFIKDKTEEELPTNSLFGVAQQGASETSLLPIIDALHLKDEYASDPISNPAEMNILYQKAMEYVAISKTDTEMKTQGTYISHSGNETGTKLIPWKFDICWTIAPTSNNGYPALTYAVISISDDLDDVYDGVIYNPYDLAEMTLAGNYYIARDIDMNYYMEDGKKKLWIPIGTEGNPFVGTLRAGVKTWDENGNATSYYTISNLQTCDILNLNNEVEQDKLATYPYAVNDFSGGGIFGATGTTARIVDIHIANSSFAYKGEGTDAAYIGAVAGINKGTIIRPVITGTVIQGDSYVGAITGWNQGRILSAIVTEIKDADGEITASTKIILNARNDKAYIGGIAGLNDKNGAISFSSVTKLTSVTEEEVTTQQILNEIEKVRVTGAVSINATGQGGLLTTVHMGGIAGRNLGSILGAVVYLEKEISAAAELDGYLGGIAGTCEESAVVTDCYVQATIDSQSSTYSIEGKPDRTPSTYVGGLVGSMSGTALLNYSATYASFLTGRYVGGLVAKVSVPTTYSMTSNVGSINWSGERKTVPTLEGVRSTVDQCFAEGISISAYKAGGLVAFLENGLITNCYVDSPNGSISSDIEGAVLAGFAAEINFGGSDKSTSQGGVIAYSYVAIKVEAVNGTAYAETSTYIKKPTQYSAGYIFSYVYDTDVLNSGVKTKAVIQTGGWGFGETAGKAIGEFFMSAADKIAGWFKSDIDDSKYEYYQGISTGSMHGGLSNPKISACGFNVNVWTFNAGGYGRLNDTSIPAEWRA